MILPYTNPKIILEGKIAIVGSSSNLIGKNLGKEIDSYPNVVRFNRAPTDGFTQDVGEKTTLRVVNQHVFSGESEYPKEREQTQPPNFIRDQKNMGIVYMGPHLAEWNKRETCIDPSSTPYLVDYIPACSWFNEKIAKNIGNNARPTVGMLFISLCICSGVKPDVYGFGVNEGTNITHYWEDRENTSSCHNYTAEREIILSLEREGKIVLH